MDVFASFVTYAEPPKLVEPGDGSFVDPSQRARHTYFGLHQRATTKSDADQVSPYKPDNYDLFYHDDQWRMLERRIDRDYEAHGLTDPWADATYTRDEIHQHPRVWGPGYIDELVCFQKDLNNNANFGNSADFRGYAATDRNFSVIATTDDNGGASGGARLEYRTRYTAYGEAKCEPAGDVDGDGNVNQSDADIIDDGVAPPELIGVSVGDNTAPGIYDADADVIRNGTINAADLTFITGSAYYGVSRVAPAGAVSPTEVDCIVGYCGYIFDPSTQMYCVRYRWYEPALGRWISRDPSEYFDGNSMYEYIGSSCPLTSADPTGWGKKSFSDTTLDELHRIGCDTITKQFKEGKYTPQQYRMLWKNNNCSGDPSSELTDVDGCIRRCEHVWAKTKTVTRTVGLILTGVGGAMMPLPKVPAKIPGDAVTGPLFSLWHLLAHAALQRTGLLSASKHAALYRSIAHLPRTAPGKACAATFYVGVGLTVFSFGLAPGCALVCEANPLQY